MIDVMEDSAYGLVTGAETFTSRNVMQPNNPVKLSFLDIKHGYF